MSSVTDIETAIQKLSLAEQRIIALHLGERLVDETYPGEFAAADEGIRHLPQYEPGPAPRETRRRRPAHRAGGAR